MNSHHDTPPDVDSIQAVAIAPSLLLKSSADYTRTHTERKVYCQDGWRWKKRALRLGPLIGLMALILAIGCMAFAWQLLKYAEGRPVSDIPEINSYLSITSSMAATLIRFAIGGGLATHWWRKAMSVRSVAYLHRQWKVGTSVLNVIKTPRGFGLVAAAVAARTLLIAVGPLLQRSVDRTQIPDVAVKVMLPLHLPTGWAGNTNPSTSIYNSSKLLENVYHDHALKKSVYINVSDCKGLCNINVTAPGLTIEDHGCILIEKAIDLSTPDYWPTDSRGDHILFKANYSTKFMEDPQWFGPKDMTPEQPLPVPPRGQESVAIHYTSVNTSNGTGFMYHRQCWLRSAVVIHEMNVDSDGQVIGQYNTTVKTIDDDAIAGPNYRQHKDNIASITAVVNRVGIDLTSSATFRGSGPIYEE